MGVKKRKVKTKKIFYIFLFIITTATITFFVLYAFNSAKKTSDVLSANDLDQISLYGPLKYALISTSKIAGGTRFTYYTTEATDKRLIALNNAIINDLKKSGKINDKTENYIIDYYSDKATVKSNYPKTGSKLLSKVKGLDKLRKVSLIDKYMASMTYSKPANINQLINISNGKIIKKY